MGENPRVALKELGILGAYRFESGIAPPTTPVNDFEIRPAMITLIERRQFSGAKSESPLNHLKEFEKYCNTIKVNDISQEFIRLKLFPFSLIGRALEWLDKEVKPNSLRTWDEVTKALLSRFYPQKKTAEARALIQGFKQRPNENLYEAWERYKEYQRECPHHGIPTYQVIQIFYRGLSAQGKEVTSIKEKLESVSTNSLSLPSQSKGRGTLSNSSPSTSNNMPCGCLFCDSCGSYDHDSSMCSQYFVDGCDDVEINECEHVNFVSNSNGGERSGRVLNEEASRSIEEDEGSYPRVEDEKVVSKSVSYEEVQEKKRSSEKEREEVWRPDLPYPQKFLRHKIDEQFGKFIVMLKEVHLSIPFTDAITQMPRYSKFLKEILSGKRMCNEVDLVEVGSCCSSFIHNELPKKMEDPGNFSILCEIKGKMFNNAFCDLGASVSVMPYSIFKKLKLGELLPSNITLQLADQTIMIPKERVEDVHLKIGGFTIPVDFIVLEIAEDDHIPIILGRPFLATSGALIDVKGGRITLRVGKKEESFDLKPMHESLSLVQGIMCANSPRSIDNVCMINSSTNDVLENCDDVLSSFDGKKVSEEKMMIPKLKDEEEVEIPHWFELYPQDGGDISMSINGEEPSTINNKPKKKACDSKKKRERKKLRKEKFAIEKSLKEVSSSNNKGLLEV
ncbi:uncharacterized protein LOC110694848 [Chenopodium quinoa]|uniref:uncharacterized protein LOC110694848 n=1 Tax=Chenopodium quinoa TaxID=63459 RepID=UPI000B798AC6|nr:uncharacterized protein LOC110694848 [Chenopodium quinoa]